MSRIGRLPITLPSGVDVTLDGQDVTVKGPKGTLQLTVTDRIVLELETTTAHWSSTVVTTAATRVRFTG